jgi:hypothetical protein
MKPASMAKISRAATLMGVWVSVSLPATTAKSWVVACGCNGEEVIVDASALEKGLKVLLLIPPLAEASCGAINIRIAMTAKAMLRQFKGNLPRVRGAFMTIRSGRYVYSPKQQD